MIVALRIRWGIELSWIKGEQLNGAVIEGFSSKRAKGTFCKEEGVSVGSCEEGLEFGVVSGGDKKFLRDLILEEIGVAVSRNVWMKES